MEKKRLKTLQSLENDNTCLYIDRSIIVKELMDLYAENTDIIKEAVCFQFKGESGSDFGGISREVFTSFWRDGCKEFCEGCSTFVFRQGLSADQYILLGQIITHGYVLTGVFPILLNKSYMVAVICGEGAVGDKCVVLDFLNLLSNFERDWLERLLKLCRFEADDIDFILELEDRYGMRTLPKPSNLLNIVTQMARTAILEAPLHTMKKLKQGMMSAPYKNLWDEISTDEIDNLYVSQAPSAKRVLNLLKTKECLSQDEDKIYSFLKRYIRELNQKECETFLQFCTGSSAIVVEHITVNFYKTIELEPLPRAHTCGSVIEIPSSGYHTFFMFKSMMDSILANPLAHKFTFQ